jgi:serine/threonine-protein kinase
VPFQGGNDAETALARLQRDPTPLLRLRPTLPPGLVDLIHRLRARNPDERPASGALVQTALARSLRSGLDSQQPTTPSKGTGVVRGTPPRGAGAPKPSPPSRTGGTNGSHTNGGNTNGGSPSSASRTAGTPRPGVRPVQHRDATPTSGMTHGRPARQFQQRRMPSLLVVGVIVAAALLISIVLISGLGQPDDGTTATDPDVATTAVETTSLPGPVVPVDGGWSSSDPDGDDRVENEESVALVHDGSGSTSWSTVCYANQYLGGKRGVGVVMTLSAPATGQLAVTFGATPWSAAVHVADELPASFEGWGAAVDSSYSPDDQAATFDLGATPARYVLISLQQLAEDPGCTGSNPYRGRISEISFQPAP